MVQYREREKLAAEWNAAAPEEPAEIATFYRTTEQLMPDLEEWHTEPFRQEWTEAIVQKLHGLQIAILDVGAGGGHDLDALAADGHVDWLNAVEPNAGARASLKKRGYFAAESIDDLPRYGYGAVICIDVLEHLVDPTEMVNKIAERTSVGGLLFEATATHDIMTPLHLKSNWGWIPDSQLRSLGFELEQTVGRMHIWRRAALKKTALTQSILTNFYRQVEPEVYDCVLQTILNGQGWSFRRNDKDGLISRARSVVWSEWYRQTADDVALMIDDDIIFEPWQAERLVTLCRDRYPIIAGAYTKSDLKSPALKFLPGTTTTFGPDQPVQEIRWAATGFMAVRREVIDAMVKTMPLCDPTDWNFWPLFLPFVMDHEYLSEDYAFCERARRLGYKVYVDPGILIDHVKPRRINLNDVARTYGSDTWNGLTFQVPEMPEILVMGDWYG